MKTYKAIATAHPNIALIKYWGNKDDQLRIPVNGSISMNMAGLQTTASVSFSPDHQHDSLILNEEPANSEALDRVSTFLDHFRELSGIYHKASVHSENNFPMGAGIASSSSAFAALALAAAQALGIELIEPELSAMARLGSGSAARSIPGGFVEWQAGESHDTSYAYSIAGPDHWDLVDLVAVINPKHKATGSGKGQQLAHTSPLQAGRIQDAPRRLGICRKAILEKDFEALAEVVEEDCNLMHAVMMTSKPPLLYWDSHTIDLINAVRGWRASGIPAFYTIDAGPNVHIITPAAHADNLYKRLESFDFLYSVYRTTPGERVQW